MGKRPQPGWTGTRIKSNCSFCRPMPRRAIRTNISITRWSSRSILAIYLGPNTISAIKQLPSCVPYNIALMRSPLSFNITGFPMFWFGSNNNRKMFQRPYSGPPFKYKKGALLGTPFVNRYFFYVIFIFGIANAEKHTNKHKFLMCWYRWRVLGGHK